MKTNMIKFALLILVFVNLSCNTTTGDIRYHDAIKEIKSGNIDFAFMKLNNYLRDNPDSIHAREIRFAKGEYYFQIKDYRDAVNELGNYIVDYPKEKNTIFAQAMLYKILLEYKSEPALQEKLKKLFFSNSVFLIFSDSKTKYYKSILNNSYKILDYVDKIEVFKNNELLFQITP